MDNLLSGLGKFGLDEGVGNNLFEDENVIKKENIFQQQHSYHPWESIFHRIIINKEYNKKEYRKIYDTYQNHRLYRQPSLGKVHQMSDYIRIQNNPYDKHKQSQTGLFGYILHIWDRQINIRPAVYKNSCHGINNHTKRNNQNMTQICNQKMPFVS